MNFATTRECVVPTTCVSVLITMVDLLVLHVLALIPLPLGILWTQVRLEERATTILSVEERVCVTPTLDSVLVSRGIPEKDAREAPAPEAAVVMECAAQLVRLTLDTPSGTRTRLRSVYATLDMRVLTVRAVCAPLVMIL